MNLALILLILCLGAHASKTCDVSDYGAVGDGKTKDTKAIQAAVDDCAGTGGTVTLRKGVFLSGTIFLRSKIKFHIDITATLKGSTQDKDYPELYPDSDNTQLADLRKSLLYAEKVTDLTIEGRGRINGSGGKLAWNIPWITEHKRPMAIFVAQSKNILIQDLRVEDAAMWAVVTMETDDVIIRGLNVHTPYLPNRDGIDIVDGHNILIENNTVYSQDDSICLKTGSKHGTKNVIVRNNTILASTFANGLKLGTASVGMFKDILFENNIVSNVNLAAMTVESIDGARVENIVFKDIVVKKTGTPFFVLLGKRKPKREEDRDIPVGSIDGVHFINIRSEKTKKAWGSPIAGTILNGVRHAPRNITFQGVDVLFRGLRNLKEAPKAPKEYEGQYPDPHMWGNLPASGLYLRHIDGVRIENSLFRISRDEDPRPLIIREDVVP